MVVGVIMIVVVVVVCVGDDGGGIGAGVGGRSWGCGRNGGELIEGFGKGGIASSSAGGIAVIVMSIGG